MAITLYRLGHYVDACSVDAAADQINVSVRAVVKSIPRVIKALAALAHEHIKWPSAERRGSLSQCSANNYRINGFIGATDGTVRRLAYKPAH